MGLSLDHLHDRAARDHVSSAHHSVSVAAVITDDEGRTLLIRRADTGEWQIPGGVLERGETIHDGLRREVLEETGLLIEPGD